MFIAAAYFVQSTIGCANSEQSQKTAYFHSPEVLKNIRDVASSVVGVGVTFTYDVETYRYVFVDGNPIRNFNSPTGFKLLSGDSGIVRTQHEHNTQGCGVIIAMDEKHCLVLTSQHVLTATDTLIGFYQDEHGRSTNLISYRAIKTKTKYFIIDQQNKFNTAKVMYSSERFDLGLLRTDASVALGREFPFAFDYERNPDWGDPVYVFGYPQSIKQLTAAIVSPSPYPGNFSLDAITRIGFSGGPVIGVQPNGNLSLIGIIRAIPATKLRYIAPPTDIPTGVNLIPEDLPRSTIQESDIIDNRAAYAVNMSKVGRFLNECLPLLEKQHVKLSQKLLPAQK